MAILQRYVLRECFWVAGYALVSLTLLMVPAVVAAVARKAGLGPGQILMLIPYLIPWTLPYTVPLSALLAVTMVFGRMAGSGEITAVKAAGISVASLLWPVLALGAVLSVGTLLLADRFVPWMSGGIRRTIVTTLEDVVYETLRSRRELHGLHVQVIVQDVVGRRLIGPTFMYRTAEGAAVVATAREATLTVDHAKELVTVRMQGATMTTSHGMQLSVPKDFSPSIPLPGWETGRVERPQDYTIAQMREHIAELQDARQEYEGLYALEAGLQALGPRPGRLLDPAGMQVLHKKMRKGVREIDRFRTELHTRRALAFSCFFFVLVGAPVAIWQQRRDFLGNFFLCFMTILVVYYPLAILGTTLCKEGMVSPWWMMWSGNGVLGVMGTWVMRRVLVR